MTTEQIKNYNDIKQWGISSWFNFHGRIGNWQYPDDAAIYVEMLLNDFTAEEDYEAANEMKVALSVLREELKTINK